MPLSVSIQIEGHTSGDVAIALDEAKRLIEQGCVQGGDSNTTGSYSFVVTGSEVAYYRVEDEAERYDCYDEAVDATDSYEAKIRMYDSQGNELSP